MTRTRFTESLASFLYTLHFEFPTYGFILDTVKRTAEEQHALFKKGLTLADGYKVLSQHQFGKAGDIYATQGGVLLANNFTKIYSDMHEIWEDEFSGKPTVIWSGTDGKVIIDWGHFE